MNNNFITINWHLTETCNFDCFFCFAKYHNKEKELHLDKNKIDTLLEKIYFYFKTKFEIVNLNLVGGEPLLSKNINYIIEKAFNLGFKVSLISNGSLINDKFLETNVKYLTTIGISIDSLNNDTNKKIGRFTKRDYKEILKLINKYPINLKINTVVNKFNFQENIVEELKEFKIKKWKIFQAINVENNIFYQNTTSNELLVKKHCSKDEFEIFIRNNNLYHLKENKYFIEQDEDLMESYVMVDPFGRFFQNINNKYEYSEKIIENDIEECFNKNKFNLLKFKKRY